MGAYGDSEMACPHCQNKGTISTKAVKRKKGLSGGKLMGGLLTGGISLFGDRAISQGVLNRGSL